MYCRGNDIDADKQKMYLLSFSSLPPKKRFFVDFFLFNFGGTKNSMMMREVSFLMHRLVSEETEDHRARNAFSHFSY